MRIFNFQIAQHLHNRFCQEDIFYLNLKTDILVITTEFPYICNMRKELGKWLMDIAKYIATAVILTSIFGDIEERWIIYLGGAVSVLATLGWGLYLVKESPGNNKKED